MKILTLAIDDQVSDQFFWLLKHFSRDEIRILEESNDVSDDDYLRCDNMTRQSSVSV